MEHRERIEIGFESTTGRGRAVRYRSNSNRKALIESNRAALMRGRGPDVEEQSDETEGLGTALEPQIYREEDADRGICNSLC